MIFFLLITYVSSHGFLAKPLSRNFYMYRDMKDKIDQGDYQLEGLPDGGQYRDSSYKNVEICGWKAFGDSPDKYKVMQKYKVGQRIALDFVLVANHGGVNGVKVKCLDDEINKPFTWKDTKSNGWIDLQLDESEKQRVTYNSSSPTQLHWPAFGCGKRYKQELKKDNQNSNLYFTTEYAEYPEQQGGKLMSTYALPADFGACKHAVGVWTWQSANKCYPPNNKNFFMEKWDCKDLPFCRDENEPQTFRNCFDFEVTEDKTCDPNNTGYGCELNGTTIMGQGRFPGTGTAKSTPPSANMNDKKEDKDDGNGKVTEVPFAPVDSNIDITGDTQSVSVISVLWYITI